MSRLALATAATKLQHGAPMSKNPTATGRISTDFRQRHARARDRNIGQIGRKSAA